MKITNFNVRIYGIVLNNKKQILIAKEEYKTQQLIKFIGGGLEKGEGIHEGLQREFKEELNVEIEVGDLFYVNDFFQGSYFNPQDQIISIYYLVNILQPIPENKFKAKEGIKQLLIWKELKQLNEWIRNY